MRLSNRGKWTLKLMIPVFMLCIFLIIYGGVSRFERIRGWYQWLIFERELETDLPQTVDTRPTSTSSIEIINGTKPARKIVVLTHIS
jgi:hypothetical protein